MFIIHCKKRRLLGLGFLAAVAALGLMLTFLVPNYLVVTVSAQKRLVPVYRVDTTRQAVAISFDASWGAEFTPKILDTLDEYGVKATFFLVNIWLEDYPEMAREIAVRGHEIGLHSTTHPHFPQLSEAKMREELTANADMIREITGSECRLFRPPFGDYNNLLLETASDLGYSTIQWSIDSLDWKDLSAEEICGRVLKKITAGDIVLFHNNGKHTAEALPTILSALAEQNLEIIPICDLLLDGDCYTDANGVQKQR